MKFIGLTIFASLTLPGLTWANWNSIEIEHLKTYEMPFENPFVASIWGTCNSPLWTPLPEKAKKKIIYAESASLDRKAFKTKYIYHPGSTKDARDLVIYFPGSFSSTTNSQAHRMRKLIYESGSNVLLIPHPWSTEFIKNGPLFFPGNMMLEAESMYQGIRSVITKIRDRHNLKKVHAIGLSSGAFLQAIVRALDAKTDRPLINSHFFISPPYDIKVSISLIDEAMDSTIQYYRPFPIVNYLSKLLRFCRLKTDENLSGRMTSLAKLLSAQIGFQEALTDSLLEYNDYFELDIVPDRDKGSSSSKFMRWIKDVRFISYLQKYTPETLQRYSGPEGQLFHWLNQSSADDYKILTTDDDFINPSPIMKNAPHTKVLNNGGHFGFRGLDWFDGLINVVFNKSN